MATFIKKWAIKAWFSDTNSNKINVRDILTLMYFMHGNFTIIQTNNAVEHNIYQQWIGEMFSIFRLTRL